MPLASVAVEGNREVCTLAAAVALVLTVLTTTADAHEDEADKVDADDDIDGDMVVLLGRRP